MVNAVRRGDLKAVTAEIARDPASVHARVYPQAYERVSQQRDYQARYGRSPWEGRYLIHDAAARGDLPILETLAAAGADLTVRLDGRSLLHLAAREGNLQVAAWLLERGAFVLCRYGADPTRLDVAGKTPYDMSRMPTRKRDPQRARTDEEAMLTAWLRPNDGCAIVAATVRATGSPVSDDDARKVFAETVAR